MARSFSHWMLSNLESGGPDSSCPSSSSNLVEDLVKGQKTCCRVGHLREFAQPVDRRIDQGGLPGAHFADHGDEPATFRLCRKPARRASPGGSGSGRGTWGPGSPRRAFQRIRRIGSTCQKKDKGERLKVKGQKVKGLDLRSQKKQRRKVKG